MAMEKEEELSSKTSSHHSLHLQTIPWPCCLRLFRVLCRDNHENNIRIVWGLLRRETSLGGNYRNTLGNIGGKTKGSWVTELDKGKGVTIVGGNYIVKGNSNEELGTISI